eukprot:88192-Rhodomonas_salina.1
MLDGFEGRCVMGLKRFGCMGCVFGDREETGLTVCDCMRQAEHSRGQSYVAVPHTAVYQPARLSTPPKYQQVSGHTSAGSNPTIHGPSSVNADPCPPPTPPASDAPLASPSDMSSFT